MEIGVSRQSDVRVANGKKPVNLGENIGTEYNRIVTIPYSVSSLIKIHGVYISPEPC